MNNVGIIKTIAKGICGFVAIVAIALLAILIIQTIDYDSDNTISTIPIVVNNTTSELTPTASTIPTSIKPTPMPTLTSTKVIIPPFPKAVPTTVATPTSEPTVAWYCRLDMTIWRMSWNTNAIALVRAVPTSYGQIHPSIEHITIYVNGVSVATIEPIQTCNRSGKYVNRNNTDYMIDDIPVLINLPDGVVNTDEITAEMLVTDTIDMPAGIYPVNVCIQTPPDRYEDECSTYPVLNS